MVVVWLMDGVWSGRITEEVVIGGNVIDDGGVGKICGSGVG